jgi:hypothetical protein
MLRTCQSQKAPLLRDRSDNQKHPPSQWQQELDLPHPESGSFVKAGERKRDALTDCGIERLLPQFMVFLRPFVSPPERFAQAPGADHVAGERKQHRKQGQLRAYALQDLTDRAKNHPVGPDQRVAHLQAAIGELSRPVLKFPADLFNGLLRRLIHPGLLQFQRGFRAWVAPCARLGRLT